MRDKSKVMPHIANPLDVKSMRVWHCSYESLSCISDCLNLEVLVIATLPESDFKFIGNCKKLKYLSIDHLPMINSLKQLENFNKLETLSLSTTPGWDSSGKVTVISSLKPLTKLPTLKHIELFGVVPENKSPSDLAECGSLVSVRLSKYSKKDVKLFYEQTGLSDDWAPEPEFAK